MLLGAGLMPDLLMADVGLEARLGRISLAGIARERRGLTEVVLISGTAPDPGQQAFGRRRRLLRMPFTPAALVEAIRSLAVAGAESDAA